MKLWGRLDENKKVIECDFMEKIEHSGKDAVGEVVEQTAFDGGWFLSTVFLGIKGHNGHWFETMLFDPDGEGVECERYRTWNEAEAGHAKEVKRQTKRLGSQPRTPSEAQVLEFNPGRRKLQVD